MQLKYGPYQFAVDGVTCKTHMTPVPNAAGMVQTMKQRMTVTGDLLAPPNSTNPQVALTALQLQLQAALGVPYLDLVFYADDGSVTATVLRNAGSLSGVHLVEGPSFMGDRSTGQYAVVRSFSFAMEVETVYPTQLTPLVSFSESLSFSGGQPIRTMARSVNKLPIDQITWPYTEFECVQSGSAVGLLAWPFGGPNQMPPLRFPASMLRGAPKVDASGPDRIGPKGYKNYGVKWTANFASALPLIAAPTLWT